MGDNIGVDIIPEKGDSSFWAQSMRVLDMGEFAQRGGYHIPESCKEGDNHADFVDHMYESERVYRNLVLRGVPVEDARLVLPMACNHSIIWTMNLMALKHIIGKRTCWVAQNGFWGPFIKGVVKELVEKIDPIFKSLLNPPCINMDDKFTGCIYKDEQMERIEGKLPLPPCGLFMYHHKDLAYLAGGRPGAAWRTRKSADPIHDKMPQLETNSVRAQQYNDLHMAFQSFWERNPNTGERL